MVNFIANVTPWQLGLLCVRPS